MTKSEILASDMPPIEKVWLIAKERSDIGAGSWGLMVRIDVYERIGSCCCPIGAVLDGAPMGLSITSMAADTLDVDPDWISGFTTGFDGKGLDAIIGHSRDAIDGHAAGQEIGRRFEAMGVQLG